MKSIDALVKRAIEYKEKGLSDKEIGDELHLSPETVTWLLSRGVGGGAPPKDVKIGWRSIGVYGNRIGFVAAAITDIILEETTKSGTEVDSILGISINGIPFATLVSEDMGKELIIYRASEERHRGGGAFSSNYASPEGKKVVIVDDVLSTGDTVKGAINDIQGVPLRALIRARAIA